MVKFAIKNVNNYSKLILNKNLKFHTIRIPLCSKLSLKMVKDSRTNGKLYCG